MPLRHNSWFVPSQSSLTIAGDACVRTWREIRVERSTFDALTRRVARQTTRRAAFAAVLGGGLVLRDPTTSEATKEAERRKDRRRKERRRQSKSSILRGHSMLIDNSAGTSAVTVEAGGSGSVDNCCTFIGRTEIPAGESRTFDTRNYIGWAWIGDVNNSNRYWFQFMNQPIGRPFFGIALNGRVGPRFKLTCCDKPRGATVEGQRYAREGESRAFDINGHVFTVRRNADKPNFKFWTVKLPPTL